MPLLSTFNDLLETHRWLTPPWHWSLTGAVSVLILIAGIGIVTGRVDSIDLSSGGDGTSAFSLSVKGRLVGGAEAGVIVEGVVESDDAIAENSVCVFTLDVPGVGRITTEKSLVDADGRFKGFVSVEELAEARPSEEGIPVAADCDLSGEDVSFPALQFGESSEI